MAGTSYSSAGGLGTDRPLGRSSRLAGRHTMPPAASSDYHVHGVQGALSQDLQNVRAKKAELEAVSKWRSLEEELLASQLTVRRYENRSLPLPPQAGGDKSVIELAGNDGDLKPAAAPTSSTSTSSDPPAVAPTSAIGCGNSVAMCKSEATKLATIGITLSAADAT